jgi:hypothetical protein
MQTHPVISTAVVGCMLTALAVVFYCGYIVLERMHASLSHISHFSYADRPWVVLNGATVMVGATTLIAMFLVGFAAKRIPIAQARALNLTALWLQVTSGIVIALLIALILSPGTTIK